VIPVAYSKLIPSEKREIRESYVKEQDGLCMWCRYPLSGNPPQQITEKYINWRLFPPNFLKHPVHLQHNHDTDMTEGAVHAYCNAVMWQYHGR
jgi:hypothetical protein